MASSVLITCIICGTLVILTAISKISSKGLYINDKEYEQIIVTTDDDEVIAVISADEKQILHNGYKLIFDAKK